MGADTFVLAGISGGIVAGIRLSADGVLPIWACVLIGLGIFILGWRLARNYSCIPLN